MINNPPNSVHVKLWRHGTLRGASYSVQGRHLVALITTTHFTGFIWTGEYYVSQKFHNRYKWWIAFNWLHNWWTPSVNWIFCMQVHIHHLWKKWGEWKNVASQKKYVFNETIIHDLWCIWYISLFLYYCLVQIVKGMLSVYMVVFTGGGKIHQDCMNAAWNSR